MARFTIGTSRGPITVACKNLRLSLTKNLRLSLTKIICLSLTKNLRLSLTIREQKVREADQSSEYDFKTDSQTYPTEKKYLIQLTRKLAWYCVSALHPYKIPINFLFYFPLQKGKYFAESNLCFFKCLHFMPYGCERSFVKSSYVQPNFLVKTLISDFC